jgi:hypothetical protein
VNDKNDHKIANKSNKNRGREKKQEVISVLACEYLLVDQD